MKLVSFLCVLVCAFLLTSSAPSLAGIGGSLKNKVTKKVEKKAEEKAEKAVEGSPESESANSGEASSTGSAESGGGGEGMRPGEGVWANYDFKPGDRVVYFEDFSTTGVGDFPQRLDFKKGNMEVVEWKGQRWLRANNGSEFEIRLPENLPQRFTLEFDFFGPGNEPCISIFDGTDNQADDDQLTWFWYTNCGVGRRGSFSASTEMTARSKEKIAYCRAMSDGKYVKVYCNDVRCANVPNSSFGRSNSLPVQIWADEKQPVMITNLRIAAGGKQIMYDQLIADGKYVTQ